MRLLAQSRWMTIHQSDDGFPFALARFTIWWRVSVGSRAFHFFRTSPQRSTFQRLSRGKELRSKKVTEKEKKSFEACNVAKKRLLPAACEETASRPYIEGRFVHVSELGAKLFCRLCKAGLFLMHVIKETRRVCARFWT